MVIAMRPDGHLVVFGAGYVGGALARRAVASGWRVTALTRNPETAAALRAAGCAVVIAELGSRDWWDAPELRQGAARVAVTVAAGGGPDGYRRSYVDGLASVVGWGRRGRSAAGAGGVVDGDGVGDVWIGNGTAGAGGHLIYTSSTSVYPQGGGARVTESDPIGGEAESTRALVEAERLAAGWPGPTTVLRLAGIYGPDRIHLAEQVRRGEASGSPDAHLNLIYRDDILDAFDAVWARSEGRFGAQGGEGFAADEPDVYNLADEGSATKGEVVAWLAARLGVAAPQFTGLPAGGRRMATPDRVIDATRARERLGWRPARRTYREGYAEVLPVLPEGEASGSAR